MNPFSYKAAGSGSGATDPDYGMVVLLLHADGANGSTTLTDYSQVPHAFTVAGNAKISTAQSVFGGSSALFDGAGSWWETSTNVTDFVFGADDFTIELRVRTTSNNRVLVDFYTTSQSGWQLFLNSSGMLQWYDTAVRKNGTIAINDGNWHHVVAQRRAGSLDFYVDGVRDGASVTGTPALVYATSKLAIGAQVASRGATVDFIGNIDEVRITRKARYSGASFVVPTAAFGNSAPVSATDPYFANVQLLLHADGADGSAVFTDSSSFARSLITASGLAQPSISATKSKFGGSSLRLDSGKALQVGANTDWTWMHTTAAKFTLEFFTAFDVAGANHTVFTTSNGSTANVGVWVGMNADRSLTFQMYNGSGGAGSSTVVATTAAGVYPNDSNMHHIVFQWDQSLSQRSLFIYVDGNLIQAVNRNGSPSVAPPTATAKIGAYNATADFIGYLDELRLTKDVWRYQGNFVVPTQAFANA